MNTMPKTRFSPSLHPCPRFAMSVRSVSPTITLTRLCAAAPDGHSLFTNLDLSFGLERTGLVGRNGTGKTTLLDLMAGIREPIAGSIHRNGTIGYLRQWPEIGENATVAEAIGLANQARPLPPRPVRRGDARRA